MATLAVTYEPGTDFYDLSGNDYYDIDRVDLVGSDLSGGTVQFSSDQFGFGQISNSVVFSKSGSWAVELHFASGTTFSAANWLADNYPPVGEMFHFVDTNGATREIVTGSRYADRMTTYGGGDVLRGAGGNDILEFYHDTLGAGAVFDGGAGWDTLSLLVSYYSADRITDFTLGTVTGIEALSFGTYVGSGGASGMSDSSAIFSAAQFATIKTVTSSVDHANLTVRGNVVDLSDVQFVRLPGPDLSASEIAVNIVGTGNNSVLTGSPIADTITASPQGSRMTGGLGADYLQGSAGNDTFLITARDAVEGDRAYGVDGGTDTIEFQSSADGDVFAMSFGYMEVVKFTGGFDSTVIADSQAFRFIDGSRIVGSSARDSLVLLATNHYNTWFNDLVFQNWSAEDTVTIVASGESDIKGTQVSDSVQGSAGDDYLYGFGGHDTLNGSSGNDTLDGGAGNDRMAGGTGNDTYIYAAGDTIVEGADAGIDTIRTALGFALNSQPTVENVTLTGSAAVNAGGNALGNALTGNSAANRLTGGDGNDTLSGAGGADTLSGGKNDDLYIFTAGDTIIEAANSGHDTVNSSISFDLAATPGVEDLALTGNGAIDGFGNALANLITGNNGANHLTGLGGNDNLNGAGANDSLEGGNGNDTLTGGTGTDTLAGGAGNDLYVDPKGDTIIEAAGGGGGRDRVESSANFSLAGAANVEDLTLTGAATNGAGNALANTLTGNSAANALSGAGGNDSISGGTGADTLSGDGGADTLIGGEGQDTLLPGTDGAVDVIRVASAADSSSTSYDILSGFDFNHDKLDVATPTAITAFNAFGTASAMRAAFFDTDLATAVGGSVQAGVAVWVVSTAGDLAGVPFLVIDANGTAGYQAGEDYVFRIASWSGSPDPTDFI